MAQPASEDPAQQEAGFRPTVFLLPFLLSSRVMTRCHQSASTMAVCSGRSRSLSMRSPKPNGDTVVYQARRRAKEGASLLNRPPRNSSFFKGVIDLIAYLVSSGGQSNDAATRAEPARWAQNSTRCDLQIEMGEQTRSGPRKAQKPANAGQKRQKSHREDPWGFP